MDEDRLIEKLRLIEAVFAGATTAGEKVAAERARNRILEKLKRLEKEVPSAEYRFTMADMWSRKVFVTLLRRYGLRPYRYKRQRYTTVMARVPKRFVDETLWPEFLEISETLRTYLADMTDRVVQQVLHQDSSEAEIIQEPAQLTLTADEGAAAVEKTSPESVARNEQSVSGPSLESSTSTGHQPSKRKKRKKRKGR